MRSKPAIAVLFSMGMTAAHAGRAAEEACPNRPVRVLTSAPGSSLDMARMGKRAKATGMRAE